MISGVSSMVRCALWLEKQLGVEILSIGRGGLDRENSCTLQGSGKNLAYTIVLDGGLVFVYAQLLNVCGDSEFLIRVGDTVENWKLICRIVGALERNSIRSLERPIEVGEGGPNSWIIA
jgi:hypothetical protein